MDEDLIDCRHCPKCGMQLRTTAQFCHSCGWVLTTVYRIATGQLPTESLLDNRYVVIEKIAQGGMGAVYKVSDTRIGNRVLVIKEMSDSSLDQADRLSSIAAFKQEARLLGNLQHPNIPTVFDSFSLDDRHYLAMEFVKGENLQEVLRKYRGQPFPEPTVRAIARQLCDVLTYLHTQSPPIIFRDLKPDNIMLQPDGQIKLIDFGIARLFKRTKSRDTVALGTPGYAAPEQYGTGQTDVRSDVYSLGATLLQLATGFDPSSSPFNFPSARSLNPNLTINFEQVIQRATQAKPANRFQTVEQLCATLSSSQQPSAKHDFGVTQWLKEKFGSKSNEESEEEAVKLDLHPVDLRPKKPLHIAVKKVLEQERHGLIQYLAAEFNKAEGKIIPLIGFKGVGTSYVANQARSYVLSSQECNLDIVVEVNFSSENSDEMLETLLRRLRLERGSLKRRLQQAINAAYDEHIDPVDEKQQKSRSRFRSPPGKSGIRVDLPFVVSFGDKFKIGGPIGVERFDEPTLPDEKDDETQPLSPQDQRELSGTLRNLIDTLLDEKAKVGFIFDKITDPSALDSLYQILGNRGISTIVVLDVEHYYAWQKDNHPLARYDDFYVPCIWGAGEKLCQHLFGTVDETIRPTKIMFSKYIEFMGQGRAKDFIRQIHQYYTPPKKGLVFWHDPGKLVIEKKHLEAIATYGRLFTAIEEDIDVLIPAMYDNHPYRYDVARLHMYKKVGWMIDRVKEGSGFSLTDIGNSEEIPEIFKPLCKQVTHNLLDHLSSNGIVEVQGDQVHTEYLIPNMNTAYLLFCQNSKCGVPLRPQANYCHKCKTAVHKNNPEYE